MKSLKNLSIVKWQDAAYSFDNVLPKDLPPPDITIGVIVENNRRFINLAFNFRKEKNNLKPIEGIIILKKTIIKITTIKNEKEE